MGFRLSKCAPAAALAGIALALAPGSRAQQAEGFEVASIKPSRSSSAESNLDSAPGGRLTATNITVRELIRLAYGVKDYQVEHAPGWIDGERYDIAAKSASSKNTSYTEEQSQVRDLLTGRFHLATHRETKQMQVYLLTVGKNGAKLNAHNEGVGSKTRKSCGHLAGTRLTMDTIATVLSRQFERDVLNRSGLPESTISSSIGRPMPDRALLWPIARAAPRPAACLPSSTAIQQQLGLRLESAKGPVEILVIDRVERPTAN